MNSYKKRKFKPEKSRVTKKFNRPRIKLETPISVIKDNISINNCTFSGYHRFQCGNNVPIYEVSNVHALNQIIGYAKFINNSYGDVYYRGECKLHSSLLPALFRGVNDIGSASKKINNKIKDVINDSNFF